VYEIKGEFGPTVSEDISVFGVAIFNQLRFQKHQKKRFKIGGMTSILKALQL
jgi:hypothetical protein